ncbi:MAG: DUF4244 domain-containing protein [Propionibacteriaceae bacterium]|jgi:hypothetical protein|nr:DUF4244 domain-containing protein [Propionibacteriaceae bacterium]
MKKLIERLKSFFHGPRDAGLALSEYAIGIVVVVAFGTVVFGVIKSEAFRGLVTDLLGWVFNLIMHGVGAG